jgi:hypothetical protein
MVQIYYYVLVTEKGNPITTDHKLPIYWNKKVAEEDAELFGAYLKRIRISDLMNIIKIGDEKPGLVLKPWM